MKTLKLILKPFIANLARTAIYFAFLFASVVFIFKDNLGETIDSFILSLSYTILPDTFFVIPIIAFLFIFFCVYVSSTASERAEDNFKTPLVVRLFLFVMNAMPIAVFQHIFLPSCGVFIVFLPLIYLVLQVLFDLVFDKFITKTPLANKAGAYKIIREIILLAASAAVFYAIGSGGKKNFSDLDLSLNFSNLGLLASYICYIVLFNAVTFFTVEYCTGIVRDEYKKNWTKYMFVFNSMPITRTIEILRNTAGPILNKIRINLSWLVLFIITAETIFEVNNSIGFNLLDGYNYDSVIIIKNALYLLFIMFVINTVIDIFLECLEKNKTQIKTKETIKTPAVKFLFGKPSLKAAFICIAAAAVFAGLFYINYRNYPFAGYYDWNVNQNKTVRDFTESCRVNTDGISAADLDTRLCTPVKNKNYWQLAELTVLQDNGAVINIYPYYDKADRAFYFLEDNANQAKIKSLSFSDSVKEVRKTDFAPHFAFSRAMTAFRLPSDTSATIFGEKPFYIVIPFYLFYFIVLALITVAVTYTIYRFNVFFKCNSKIILLLQKTAGEIIKYLNTLTLMLVFLLLNMLLQDVFDVQWINMPFAFSFLSYALVQLVIIVLFSDNYAGEIQENKNKILASDEFKYYSLIGMDEIQMANIYHEKYGRLLLLKLVFQNILFVLNINFFFAYAFNIWRGFKDSIGITYNISFENIFTKIVHFNGVKTGAVNFGIFILLDIVLFLFYNSFDKKSRADK